MTSQATELLQQALQLPESQRAELAEKLYESLASAPFADDEIRAAWLLEIQGRAAESDAGLPSAPLDEAWPRMAGNANH
ncbi:MAG: addiction module protein [Planctomycetaceae bacterium]|nr:addiction module protein [Planctomycetaceae bacterium]